MEHDLICFGVHVYAVKGVFPLQLSVFIGQPCVAVNVVLTVLICRRFQLPVAGGQVFLCAQTHHVLLLRRLIGQVQIGGVIGHRVDFNARKLPERDTDDLLIIMHSAKEKKHSALVQSAIYFLEKEYAGSITVQSLANELEVSVNHLIAAFKKETQLTPNLYLREFRLKQAARLLAATDQSVQEIAANVGISDANYMIKLFREKYGEAPTAYRKKYRM